MRIITIVVSIVLVAVMAFYCFSGGHSADMTDLYSAGTQGAQSAASVSSTEIPGSTATAFTAAAASTATPTPAPASNETQYTIVCVDDLLEALETNAYSASQQYKGMNVVTIAKAGNISSDGSGFYLYETEEGNILSIIDWHVRCKVSDKSVKSQLSQVREGQDCIVYGRITGVGTSYTIDVHHVGIPSAEDYTAINAWKKMRLEAADLYNVIGLSYQGVCAMLPRVSKLEMVKNESTGYWFVTEECKLSGISGSAVLFFDSNKGTCIAALFYGETGLSIDLTYTSKLGLVYEDFIKILGKPRLETSGNQSCSFYEAALLDRDFDIEWRKNDLNVVMAYSDSVFLVITGKYNDLKQVFSSIRDKSDENSGVSVTVTAQTVCIRDASGNDIAYVSTGTTLKVTGYSSSLDSFRVDYNGQTGYIKGIGLNYTIDELMAKLR